MEFNFMILSAQPVTSGLQVYLLAGRTEQMTGLILFAFAISHMDTILPKMSSSSMYPLFFAMSFVPARITRYFGCRFTTSFLIRTSICEVVCPDMPRQRKLWSMKNSESVSYQPWVMLSPINTAFGRTVTSEFAFSYLFRFAQSS